MKVLFQILKLYKAEIFLLFWIFSLLGTVLYKTSLFYFQIDHTIYLWITEILFLFIIVLYFIKEKNFYAIKILGLLFLIKLIGSLLVYERYLSHIDFYKDLVKTSFGYSFVFLMFYYLKSLDLKQVNKLFSFFKILCLIVYITIFLGAVFSIKLFETYIGSRFGFSGIFFPSSYGSYFIIISILIFYFYSRYIQTIPAVYIVVASLAGVFTGTKSSYLFLTFFWAYIFFQDRYYKNTWFWTVFALAVINLLIFKEKILTILEQKFAVLYDSYLKNDFITFALSYRDVSAQKAKLFIQENWLFLNYLFGGVDRRQLLVEISLADLFLNFGLVGTVIFFTAYTKLILSKLTKENVIVFSFTLVFIITIMGGNFFDRFYLAYPLSLLFIICLQRKNIF